MSSIGRKSTIFKKPSGFRESIMDFMGLTNTKPQQDPVCFHNINDCKTIIGDPGKIVGFIIGLPHLEDNIKNEKERIRCIQESIEVFDFILKENCSINFENKEIELMLNALNEVKLNYYNPFTLKAYNLIFRFFKEKLNKYNKIDYTNYMTKHLKETRIFFHDSLIFEKNFLTDAAHKLSISDYIHNNTLDKVYPDQLKEIGLQADFYSYFLYLHFLFSEILDYIKKIILDPDDLLSLGKFVNIFPSVMDNYIFLPANMIIGSFVFANGDKIAPEPYKNSNIIMSQAKIIMDLITVFMAELQFIFPVSTSRKINLNCNKLSQSICDDFETNLDECKKYDNLLEYADLSEQSINKIKSGTGRLRYYFMKYYLERPDREITSISGQKTGDNFENAKKFHNILKEAGKKNKKFKENLEKTVEYLKLIQNEKCIQSTDDLVLIIKKKIQDKKIHSRSLTRRSKEKIIYNNIPNWNEDSGEKIIYNNLPNLNEDPEEQIIYNNLPTVQNKNPSMWNEETQYDIYDTIPIIGKKNSDKDESLRFGTNLLDTHDEIVYNNIDDIRKN